MVTEKKHHLSTKSKVLSETVSYIPCYGLGCLNAGRHVLLIALINRKGFFCDKCKHELESSDLVIHESRLGNGVLNQNE